jgi:hypothetical protein
MVRSGIGVVVGAAAWMFAFFAQASILVWTWPDYAVNAAAWMDAQRFEFTTGQGWFNLLFWLLAETFAGWLAVVIARRREAAWALAALIGPYMAYMHLYAEWDRIPWWYNLAAAIPVVPALLLGGWMARRFAVPRSATAPAVAG